MNNNFILLWRTDSILNKWLRHGKRLLKPTVFWLTKKLEGTKDRNRNKSVTFQDHTLDFHLPLSPVFLPNRNNSNDVRRSLGKVDVDKRGPKPLVREVTGISESYYRRIKMIQISWRNMEWFGTYMKYLLRW